MTQEERNMLSELAQKISQTPSPQHDAEAEDFIRKNIGSRPDALYLMTQTVLIQNMALQQSQRQIQDLQQRAGQLAPQGGGSFLGQQANYGSNPQAQTQPQYGASYGTPAYSAAPAAPSAMSGFLRGAAQTAAGVAAGTLAVQGIESLFSHHEGSGLFGGGGGYGQPGETIVENNYYGDPNSSGDRFNDTGSDRFADSSNLADSSNNDLMPQDVDDSSNFDDSTSNDDSSFGDFGGNDDNFA